MLLFAWKRIFDAMQIKNLGAGETGLIFELYRHATALQRQLGMVTWPEFDLAMIRREIEENRQWKLIDDNGETAFIWATTFDDPLIWEERNNDPSVYIHRIATHPARRGHDLVKQIVSWARQYAAENKRQFIRLDTVGENKKLIAHYTNCGFRFLGLHQLKNTADLPAHYHNAAVSLFEIKL